MSGSKIQHYKYDALTKELDEKIAYVEKNCILKNDMQCKKKMERNTKTTQVDGYIFF